ncbi:aromatic acid exporter family protein [Bacillus pinisoli]|uniref:aromatic acid exporter family protein n=1 Tax=Bacillus pinisoli TaxID=2901866 RepID=UPI001FF5E06D|nr:aromatic acid exporter family protein [Bacillus pinisoli]
MKIKIGYRTIKTALGVTIAVWISSLLELDYYLSAGIITILCIQATKKKSLQSSWSRFLACTIAMAFSIVFFQILGYEPWVIGLLMIFFIPVTVYFRIQEGIVTSSVIIFHLYSEETYSQTIILNEFALIVIGIGIALLMNLYMPSVDHQLKKYQVDIERYFSGIFKEIVNYIRLKNSDWDGHEITMSHHTLEKAKSLAIRDVQNHLLRHENIYYSYFRIREQQLEILERILPLVIPLNHSGEEGEKIADFLEDISNSIHPGNTANRFLLQIEELKREFRESELPKTREEFEVRASLFQLLKEMEQYLIIKSYFRPNE